MFINKQVDSLRVNQYFFQQVEKVSIDRGNYLGIETFEKYLSYRYRDNCYYYSAWALMGLEISDKVVRGRINLDGNKRKFIGEDNSNYFHGWVEFNFNGKDYVFDPMQPIIVTKKWYYKNKQPIINYEATLEEVIQMCINDKETKQIGDCTYQTGALFMKYYHYGGQIEDNTYLSFPMSKAIIELQPGKNKIKKFIANMQPAG